MIDLLTILPLSLALHGPAHDSLASGPQPRELAWTHNAAFEPVNGDVIYTEKWSAVADTMEIRTRLRPGRGITNSPEALGRVSGYRETQRPDLPVTPLCCRHTPETPQGDPVPPVSKVPLPAGLWFTLAWVATYLTLRRNPASAAIPASNIHPAAGNGTAGISGSTAAP